MSAGTQAVRLRDAIEPIVRRAGKHLLAAFETLDTREVEHKKTSIDLVTRLDRESQTLLVDALRAAFPEDTIVAEEGEANRAPREGRIWLVDPLDGTTNFVHGVPVFAVSVALVDDGRLQAGAVYAPYLHEFFWAATGQGAWLGERRLAVSDCGDLADALLASGFPYDIRTNRHNNLAEWSHMATRCRGLRRCGAASLDLAWVAAGRLDGYWEFRLAPWDLAAGALLVREAGGVLSAPDGGAEFLWRGDLVAANVGLHAHLLRELHRACGMRGRNAPE